MELFSIDTGLFKLDGGAMFGVVPKSIWNKTNPADENNMCTWAMRCLLVQTGNRLVLIDTGIGDKQDARFFSHYYLHGEGNLIQSIRKAGFSPEDVTDVLLTHLHFDHCGGAVKYKDASKQSLELTFPKATYWSNEHHWNWAVNPNPREKASFIKENIFPLQESGQLRMVEQEGNFLQGLDLVFVHGHTEAMMLPLISYKGQRLLYTADLIPSAGHIPIPYVMGYDVRPLETLKEKTMLLDRAEKENWLLFFEHDAHHQMVSLQREERGIRKKDVLTLTDL